MERISRIGAGRLERGDAYRDHGYDSGQQGCTDKEQRLEPHIIGKIPQPGLHYKVGHRHGNQDGDPHSISHTF